MTRSNPELEAIRTKVDAYQRLSGIKRLGQRMLGNAPTRDDREALRQHDLGPIGRTKENVFEAIGYSRRAGFTVSDSTENAVAKAAFDMGDYPEMTRPTKLKPRYLEAAKQLFPVSADGQTNKPADIDQMNSVAFFVGEYKGLKSDQVQAAEADVIGLVAMRGTEYAGHSVLSTNDMKELDPDLMQGLEEISSVVLRGADKALTEQYQAQPHSDL